MLLIWEPHFENHRYRSQSLSLKMIDSRKEWCLYCVLYYLSSLFILRRIQDLFIVVLVYFRQDIQSKCHVQKLCGWVVFLLQCDFVIHLKYNWVLLDFSFKVFPIIFYLISWICRILKINLCKTFHIFSMSSPAPFHTHVGHQFHQFWFTFPILIFQK